MFKLICQIRLRIWPLKFICAQRAFSKMTGGDFHNLDVESHRTLHFAYQEKGNTFAALFLTTLVVNSRYTRTHRIVVYKSNPGSVTYEVP